MQKDLLGKCLPRPALALAAVVPLSLLLPRFIDTGNIQMNDYRIDLEPYSKLKHNTVCIMYCLERVKGSIGFLN